MGSERLSQDAWIAAGFRSLAERGPSALQINLLAAKLSTTKGSFYWHFKDLSAYKSAMLALWRSRAVTEIIARVEEEDTAEAQLAALFEGAAAAAPDGYGGRKVEPAIRAWALSDADVAAALGTLFDRPEA